MEHDYGKELENLKVEMENLKSLFEELTVKITGKVTVNLTGESNEMGDKGSKQPRKVHPMKNTHSDPRLNSIMQELCEITDKKDRTGSVTYLGVFTSGGRQSNWIQNEVNTDDLLTLIENRSATTVLQCIGNNDRLTLLLALLRTPMTVAAMVEKCSFNSTGQVYHHLKPLIVADLVSEVEQGDRGVYAVRPHRVQGIIMMLSGISDLLDTKYSRGDWIETPSI